MNRRTMLCIGALVVCLGAAWAGLDARLGAVPSLPMDASSATPPHSLGNSLNDLVNAEQILIEAGFETATAPLIELLGNRSVEEELRYWAALVLGEIGGAGAQDALIETLSEDSADLRFAAVTGLGLLGEPGGSERVSLRLADESMAVRRAAIGALGRLGDTTSRMALEGALDSAQQPSVGLRASAARQLGRIGDGAAAPALELFVQAALSGDPGASVDPHALIEEARATPRPCDPPRSEALALAAAGSVAWARLEAHEAVPFLALAALDPCTEEWMRIDAIEEIEASTGEVFEYVKPFSAPSTEEEQRGALDRVADWWTENQASYL